MYRIWVINYVREDADLAYENIRALLSLTEEDRIIDISDDGSRHPGLVTLSKSDPQFEKVHYSSLRLKQPTLGFAWTQRYLKLALGSIPSLGVITKIDPDTIVNGPYPDLPRNLNLLDRVVIANWTYDREGNFLPMGGYLNFTVPAAKDLISAPNDKKLRFGVHRHSQDLQLAYLCREMNIRAYMDETLSLKSPLGILYHPIRNKRR